MCLKTFLLKKKKKEEKRILYCCDKVCLYIHTTCGSYRVNGISKKERLTTCLYAFFKNRNKDMQQYDDSTGQEPSKKVKIKSLIEMFSGMRPDMKISFST